MAVDGHNTWSLVLTNQSATDCAHLATLAANLDFDEFCEFCMRGALDLLRLDTEASDLLRRIHIIHIFRDLAQIAALDRVSQWQCIQLSNFTKVADRYLLNAFRRELLRECAKLLA